MHYWIWGFFALFASAAKREREDPDDRPAKYPRSDDLPLANDHATVAMCIAPCTKTHASTLPGIKLVEDVAMRPLDQSLVAFHRELITPLICQFALRPADRGLRKGLDVMLQELLDELKVPPVATSTKPERETVLAHLEPALYALRHLVAILGLDGSQPPPVGADQTSQALRSLAALRALHRALLFDGRLRPAQAAFLAMLHPWVSVSMPFHMHTPICPVLVNRPRPDRVHCAKEEVYADRIPLRALPLDSYDWLGERVAMEFYDALLQFDELVQVPERLQSYLLVAVWNQYAGWLREGATSRHAQDPRWMQSNAHWRLIGFDPSSLTTMADTNLTVSFIVMQLSPAELVTLPPTLALLETHTTGNLVSFQAYALLKACIRGPCPEDQYRELFRLARLFDPIKAHLVNYRVHLAGHSYAIPLQNPMGSAAWAAYMQLSEEQKSKITLPKP